VRRSSTGNPDEARERVAEKRRRNGTDWPEGTAVRRLRVLQRQPCNDTPGGPVRGSWIACCRLPCSLHHSPFWADSLRSPSSASEMVRGRGAGRLSRLTPFRSQRGVSVAFDMSTFQIADRWKSADIVALPSQEPPAGTSTIDPASYGLYAMCAGPPRNPRPPVVVLCVRTRP
jgi:hypothetical protein